MAILSVRKLFTDRGGPQDLTKKIELKEMWEVVSDTTLSEQEAANAIDPVDSTKFVPDFGDTHADVPGCYVVGIEPNPSDESPFICYVTINYSNRPDFPTPNDLDSQGNPTPGSFDRQPAPDNPLARPASWKIGSIDKQEIIREWVKVKPSGSVDFFTPANWVAATAYKIGTYVVNNNNVYWCVVAGTSAGAGGPNGTGDAVFHEVVDNGVTWKFYSTLLQATTDISFAIATACLNSGKLPFDPPAMTEISIPTILVTVNIPAISVAYCVALKNAVNKTVWKGAAPRVAKILNVSASNKVENNISFVEFTWEIGFDPRTWDARILDAGYGTYVTEDVPNPAYPAPGEPRTITKKDFTAFKDAKGEVISVPVPMDGRGGKLDPDAEPVFLRGIPVQQQIIDFNEAIPWG